MFGTDRIGELGYADQLLASARAGMIVLADRNFAAATWITALAATGADVLVRVKNNRRMPVCRALADGSFQSRIGRVEVRVITAQVTITTSEGRRTQTYRLVTTVLNPNVPALEIVALYDERWEIETGFAELKSTSLGGRVLTRSICRGAARSSSTGYAPRPDGRHPEFATLQRPRGTARGGRSGRPEGEHVMLFAVLLPVLVVLFLLAMERFEAWVGGPPDHDAGVPQVSANPDRTEGPHRVEPHPAAALDSRATNAANPHARKGPSATPFGCNCTTSDGLLGDTVGRAGSLRSAQG